MNDTSIYAKVSPLRLFFLIAIPGVCAYNRLNATVRGLIADMEGFADDLVGRIALEFQA